MSKSPGDAVSEKQTQPRPSDETRDAMLEVQSSLDMLVWEEEHEQLISQTDSEETRTLDPTLVRASAGTGKTYKLTARLMRILLQGASPETILATTFTRKAAGEILHRILTTLADAADEGNPDALQQLREQVGIPTLPRVTALQILDKLLRNIHRLRICTLDSFFSQLARSFPYELDLPTAWRLTDEIEEVWLKERAIDNVISLLEPSEMMTVLSMLGKGEASRSITRELMFVVNAAYALQRQCKPGVWEKLVAPTAPSVAELDQAAGVFRSAEAKQERIKKRFRQMADQIDGRNFEELTTDTLIGHIGRSLRTGEPVTYYKVVLGDEVGEACETVYDAVRTAALSLLVAQNKATGTVLDEYDHRVRSLKQAARVLGFDDVTVRLAQRFADLDHETLSSRLDGAIDHLLLDEFQDTSPAQWQVLRPLAIRCAAGQQDSEGLGGRDDWQVKHSFFCVGDTKQAIYGWRGGVSEIFDAVADQVPGIQEDELNQSYRSSPVIIDFVNQTFSNLNRHPIAQHKKSEGPADKASHEAAAVDGFARRFPMHQSAKPQLPGFVRFSTSRRPAENNAQQQKLACYEEAANLAARLNSLTPTSSIGILTRTNRGVAYLIGMLERLNVHASQEGGNPLTDSAAVEVILSALMMAEHPGDLRWAFHLSSTSLAGLTPEFVRHQIEEFGLAELIQVLANRLAADCSSQDRLRLKQLVHLAMSYQQHAGPRVRDFVRMAREKRIERPQAAPVRVMTIHQAKGLEFDAVILPELDSEIGRQSAKCIGKVDELGDPPSAMTRWMGGKQWHFLPPDWQKAFGKQQASAMNESLCLLYVAITRAKHALHMIVPPATKQEYNKRTGGSLVYHALGCSEDPTAASALLFEMGDPNWFQEMASQDAPASSKRKPANTKIHFRQMPAVPRRNRKES